MSLSPTQHASSNIKDFKPFEKPPRRSRYLRDDLQLEMNRHHRKPESSLIETVPSLRNNSIHLKYRESKQASPLSDTSLVKSPRHPVDLQTVNRYSQSLLSELCVSSSYYSGDSLMFARPTGTPSPTQQRRGSSTPPQSLRRVASSRSPMSTWRTQQQQRLALSPVLLSSPSQRHDYSPARRHGTPPKQRSSYFTPRRPLSSMVIVAGATTGSGWHSHPLELCRESSPSPSQQQRPSSRSLSTRALETCYPNRLLHYSTQPSRALTIPRICLASELDAIPSCLVDWRHSQHFNQLLCCACHQVFSWDCNSGKGGPINVINGCYLYSPEELQQLYPNQRAMRPTFATAVSWMINREGNLDALLVDDVTGNFQVVNLERGQVSSSFGIEKDNQRTSCLDVSGPVVAVSHPSSAGSIMVYDLRIPIHSGREHVSSSEKSQAVMIYPGHPQGGTRVLRYSPHQPFYLASGGHADGTVRIWDARQTQRPHLVLNHVASQRVGAVEWDMDHARFLWTGALESHGAVQLHDITQQQRACVNGRGLSRMDQLNHSTCSGKNEHVESVLSQSPVLAMASVANANFIITGHVGSDHLQREQPQATSPMGSENTCLPSFTARSVPHAGHLQARCKGTLSSLHYTFACVEFFSKLVAMSLSPDGSDMVCLYMDRTFKFWNIFEPLKYNKRLRDE